MKFGIKHMLMAPEDDKVVGGTNEEVIDDKSKGSGIPEDNKDKGPGALDVSKLDPAVQKLIKDLRDENAKSRKEKTDVKSRLDKFEENVKKIFGQDKDDKETPEQKIEKMAGENEAISVRNAILEMAMENEIPAGKVEYFEFLMNKELQSLGDDDELTEDQFEAVLLKVKSSGAGNSANSSVGNGGKGKDPDKKTEVTIEQFARMGLNEKSKLYTEKPELYKTLWDSAKLKKLI